MGMLSVIELARFGLWKTHFREHRCWNSIKRMEGFQLIFLRGALALLFRGALILAIAKDGAVLFGGSPTTAFLQLHLLAFDADSSASSISLSACQHSYL